MKKLTIFTPTYNRAHLLPRLYDSLCRQTCKDFEWLIIDDGSSDHTPEVVSEFMTQNKITIRYIKQENGGKHRALNRGVGATDSKLFFIVDSDDYLIDNAVVVVLQKWRTVENSDVIGLCFRRAHLDGSMIGRPFTTEGLLASMRQITLKHKVNVDRAEVFCTAVLKQYPFDDIEGERFLTEAIVWNRISGALACYNDCIYLCDYQQEGLTSNFKKLMKQNPKGLHRYYAELLRSSIIWTRPVVVLKTIVRYLQTF